MRVEFENLGRNLKNFTAEIKDVTYENLYRLVKPYLLSREIDFSYSDITKTGVVIVGAVRVVGRFKVYD